MIIIDMNTKGSSAYHLASDLPGPEGTEELLTFAKRIGLKPEGLRHAGTHREHFEVCGNDAYYEAIEAGATQVDNMHMADVMVSKTWTTEDYAEAIMKVMVEAGLSYSSEAKQQLARLPREMLQRLLREMSRHRPRRT